MSTEKTPRTLKEFVLRHITGEQAAKLHKLLDLSKVKLARRFNYPQEATLNEVLDLAAFIKQSPFTLIQEYKMGRDKITLSDMEDREELQEGFVYMQEIDDEQAA